MKKIDVSDSVQGELIPYCVLPTPGEPSLQKPNIYVPDTLITVSSRARLIFVSNPQQPHSPFVERSLFDEYHKEFGGTSEELGIIQPEGFLRLLAERTFAIHGLSYLTIATEFAQCELWKEERKGIFPTLKPFMAFVAFVENRGTGKINN